MTNTVLVTRDAGVATVTLNRPESLNALSSELMDALPGVLRELANDPDVACVVLTGAGRAFCAGGDLKTRQAELDAQKDLPDEERLALATPYRVEAKLRARVESARLLHEMPKPTIAMINGACAGAGLALAGACDLRYAGESAVFTSAFTRAGLSGDFGGSWFWTRILGTAKARELYLLPRRLTAVQALDFGMLNAVVPDAGLQSHVTGIARSLADGPRWASTYAKSNLNLAVDGSLEQVLRAEATHMGLSARTSREHGFQPSTVLRKGAPSTDS
ncbi:enoyl-CoA hydratase-related protein [Ramlibacter sp.]|uniref:enoyl-CoA hydratase-related protein n=1 Tax=Ramlibacter sp. TaxID=1917967 RepID=UPI003D126908